MRSQRDAQSMRAMKPRFAVKAVFQYAWGKMGAASGVRRKFEVRISVLRAVSEKEAIEVAHRRFMREDRSTPLGRPGADRESVRYLGVSDVLKLGAEMDPGEIWYEFVPYRPKIAAVRPRR
jgi:hypothetical protein